MKLVAPHAGAWIETSIKVITSSVFLSPLTQGRGLKQLLQYPLVIFALSPLTQGRGLKPFLQEQEETILRRPSRRGVD